MKYSVIVSINNGYEIVSNFLETIIRNTNFDDGELIIIQKGYSVANNIAVQQSSGNYLVFINCDVFPEKASIEKLVDYLTKYPNTGAVQGKLVYPQNNLIQSTGHLFMKLYNSHIYKGKPSNHPLVMREGKRQALTTAFCAMSRNIFNKNNGFDECYYNAYEGMELTLKIYLSGKECIYYPNAVAYHITGSTRNNIQFDNEMAGRIFWSRWGNRITTDIQDYLYPQVSIEIKKHTYFLINCSSLFEWKEVLKSIEIETNGEINISERFGRSVNLYDNLPFESLNYPSPYLFLCDDFKLLAGNYNWCKVRNNSKDIVIDSHGNIELFWDIVGLKR